MALCLDAFGVESIEGFFAFAFLAARRAVGWVLYAEVLTTAGLSEMIEKRGGRRRRRTLL
ncbi:hypothetical protein D2E49_04305 [Mycobacteroides abscessus]|nr:hypothetical protein D2E49_04305 [Mycobacteroides abscessus]RIS31418.1 hypothetical protein D2E47_09025 [Mycobacteroides abscessus]RIU30422.1 hypothetical protein D2E96_20735 [Mycobacteroides abscessus]